jgi:hypothetical protein
LKLEGALLHPEVHQLHGQDRAEALAEDIEFPETKVPDSQTTTKLPEESEATTGTSWESDVYVLTRKSGPRGAPVLT